MIGAVVISLMVGASSAAPDPKLVALDAAVLPDITLMCHDEDTGKGMSFVAVEINEGTKEVYVAGPSSLGAKAIIFDQNTLQPISVSEGETQKVTINGAGQWDAKPASVQIGLDPKSNDATMSVTFGAFNADMRCTRVVSPPKPANRSPREGVRILPLASAASELKKQ